MTHLEEARQHSGVVLENLRVDGLRKLRECKAGGAAHFQVAVAHRGDDEGNHVDHNQVL